VTPRVLNFGRFRCSNWAGEGRGRRSRKMQFLGRRGVWAEELPLGKGPLLIKASNCAGSRGESRKKTGKGGIKIRKEKNPRGNPPPKKRRKEIP